MTDLELAFGNLRLRASPEQILDGTCGHSFTCFYEKNEASELAALCDIYGSDKREIALSGHPYPWTSHTYTDFYESLFDHCREHVRRVFECGIGTNNPKIASNMGATGRPGASLRVWKEYFPNAEIYGADIDRDILVREDRITTFHVDQTLPVAIRAMWEEIGVADFDIIIDDGLHTFEAGQCLFEHSFSRLRKGGIYVIEDVAPQAMVRFRAYFTTVRRNVQFVTLRRRETRFHDNALIVIRN